MDYYSEDQARVALGNPALPAADLGPIAQNYPNLRLAVAAHPNAYPGLLDWLRQVGDPSVQRVVDSRGGGLPATPQWTPQPVAQPAYPSPQFPVAQPVFPNQQQPMWAPAYPGQPYPFAPQRSNKKPLLIALAVVAVIGIILAIVIPATRPSIVGTWSSSDKYAYVIQFRSDGSLLLDGKVNSDATYYRTTDKTDGYITIYDKYRDVNERSRFRITGRNTLYLCDQDETVINAKNCTVYTRVGR